MRDAVRAACPAFLERFEGRVRNMYLDTLGLVTCGIGLKIDPMADAFPLPWVHKLDGTPATRAEVVTDWNTVKAAQALRRLGGGHFAQLTKVCLTDATIDALLRAKVAQIEASVRTGFGRWDEFPAPAQLAILDMAYNMGPAFGFPHFRADVNVGAWLLAATECKIDGAPADRNAAHVSLFIAAASAVPGLGDPDALALP